MDLVVESHSRGIALHNLCPFYIKLLPSNQVMYIGLPTQTQMADSVVNPEVLNLDNSFIRKRVSEQVTFSFVDMESKKQKKLMRVWGLLGVTCVLRLLIIIKFKFLQLDHNMRKINDFLRIILGECLASLVYRYANPEGVCTTSSNIYCLSVLFF